VVDFIGADFLFSVIFSQIQYLALDYLLIGSLPIYKYGQDFGASARYWA
jgi:hypothetical protein